MKAGIGRKFSGEGNFRWGKALGAPFFVGEVQEFADILEFGIEKFGRYIYNRIRFFIEGNEV